MNPTPTPTQAPPPSGRQAVLTAVYGTHAERLDETFVTFQRSSNCTLHAFVVGRELPRRQLEGIHYHLRPPDPAFGHPMRDVDYRRWLFVDEVEADWVLVVDGLDVACLRPLPPFVSLLREGWVAASVEHQGGRYLPGGLYTSNFVNAGVTFWNVRASRPLRQEVVARGRRFFRSLVDDQLALNEVLHCRYPDRLVLLPCHYNYRASLGIGPWGWPRTRSLDGVYLYHNGHWVRQALRRKVGEAPPLAPLPAEERPPGRWTQWWRRLAGRWRRWGLPPWWPRG